MFVQPARQQFFARAAFAQQQNGDFGRRHFFDHGANGLGRSIGGDEAGDLAILASTQAPVFGFQLIDPARPIDDQRQNCRVDRLGAEVIRAEPDGAHRVFLLILAADDDDLGIRRDFENLFQRRKPFDGRIRMRRQAEIERHHRRPETAHRGQGLGPIGGERNLAPLEAPFQLLLDARVVIDDQQPV